MTDHARAATDSRTGATRRWLTYLRERSPLPLLLLVGLAQSLSANALVTGGLDPIGIAASTLGIIALLALMRLMDEAKDAGRDRVAHPERPIPRGLLTEPEVRRAIGSLGAALAGLAIVVGLVVAPIAGALYVATVGYAFLMYRDFFIRDLAAGNAFTYAITHQVIVIPLCMFSVACMAPGEAFSGRTGWFALTALGASFVIEVSRKLDPDAHPILRTYLREHGPRAAAAGIAGGLLVLAVAAYRIDVHPIVWPFIALVVGTLPVLVVRPRRFRVVQVTGGLVGLAQVLAPIIRYGSTVIP